MTTGLLLIALLGAGAPSWACACGALVADEHIGVGQERAVVRVGDGTQTVILGLGVESVTPEAALVLPTPAPAEVALSDPEVFRELGWLSRPEVEYVNDWWPRHWLRLWGGVGGAGEGSGVEVLGESRLGAFDVATLAAEDPHALSGWLDEHGYALDGAVEEELEPYVAEGWFYVAVKLASEDEEEALNGDLEPIRVDFATEEPVYPMRLSAAADTGQSVRVHVLAEHRMERVDASADAVPAEVAFAGRVAPGDVDDAETADLIGEDGAFLTTLDHDIPDPAAIESDFRFAPAAEDSEVRLVETEVVPYYILGVAAGPFVVGASVLGLVVATVVVGAALAWSRRRRDQADV